MGYVNSLEGKPTKQRKETSSQGQGFRNHVHFSAFAPGDKRVPWKLRKRFETGEIPKKKKKKKKTNGNLGNLVLEWYAKAVVGWFCDVLW